MLEFQQRPRSAEPGPLYDDADKITADLERMGLVHGDCFYRASNAKGKFGLPFSVLTARATKSPYSHAATAVLHHDEWGMLEVNDAGTSLVRLVDWLGTCHTSQFAIARLENQNYREQMRIESGILAIIHERRRYDFTFSDPNLFYCTESCAKILNDARPGAFEGVLLKDVVDTWVYIACLTLNPLFKMMKPPQSLNFTDGLYFVGNRQLGMMASKHVPIIYEHGVAA